jgi:hypothetical protein
LALFVAIMIATQARPARAGETLKIIRERKMGGVLWGGPFRA